VRPAHGHSRWSARARCQCSSAPLDTQTRPRAANAVSRRRRIAARITGKASCRATPTTARRYPPHPNTIPAGTRASFKRRLSSLRSLLFGSWAKRVSHRRGLATNQGRVRPMVRLGAPCCPRRAFAVDRSAWCANISGAAPGNAASGAGGSPASARRLRRRAGTASGCTP